jgi:HTH-type transcriptional regulator, sugar sensing transcriptional regulator
MEMQHLKEIGFTDNEIRIYLELLKRSEALASELSEATGVNRTLTYQILSKLLKRGVVGYVIKNNTKYFKAAHPSKLLEFLKEKEKNVENMISELLTLAKPNQKSYSVELYEGKEGLKTVMNDIVKTKPKEWLDITSGLTIDVLPDFFMDNWEKRRTEAKIKARFLLNSTTGGKQRGKQLERLKLSEVRYLPKGLQSPSHIYVYGNKVGIALWAKEFPFSIVIESEEIAKRFKEFFEWFWATATKS